jgi:hypothetical protein
MNPSFQFLRALPSPPDINIADIKGNATDEEKLINAKGFHHFITMGDFGTDISKRLRLTGLSFDDVRRECELTLEIEVIKGMKSSVEKWSRSRGLFRHGQLSGGAPWGVFDASCGNVCLLAIVGLF